MKRRKDEKTKGMDDSTDEGREKGSLWVVSLRPEYRIGGDWGQLSVVVVASVSFGRLGGQPVISTNATFRRSNGPIRSDLREFCGVLHILRLGYTVRPI